ncbi:PE domain-containing protein [Tsukamurella hominis]|uniref:PE domain-containing protein n=1 Tax=Tsukamurella hominis TaxID=1970232 RepID=UPI0039E8DF47
MTVPFVHVEPDVLALSSLHAAASAATTSAEIATVTGGIAAPVPSGSDAASLLATAQFTQHGMNFLGVGIASQVELGVAAGGLATSAAAYEMTDFTNAATA